VLSTAMSDQSSKRRAMDLGAAVDVTQIVPP
jgi:hypothetical protein